MIFGRGGSGSQHPSTEGKMVLTSLLTVHMHKFMAICKACELWEVLATGLGTHRRNAVDV